MQLFAHKYNFRWKQMQLSHLFTATKACPNYEAYSCAFSATNEWVNFIPQIAQGQTASGNVAAGRNVFIILRFTIKVQPEKKFRRLESKLTAECSLFEACVTRINHNFHTGFFPVRRTSNAWRFIGIFYVTDHSLKAMSSWDNAFGESVVASWHLLRMTFTRCSWYFSGSKQRDEVVHARLVCVI